MLHLRPNVETRQIVVDAGVVFVLVMQFLQRLPELLNALHGLLDAVGGK